MAKAITKALQEYGPEYGLIFISVQPFPIEGGQSKEWKITLGTSQKALVAATGHLVTTTLSKIGGLKGHRFVTEVALGEVGQCKS